MKTLIFVIVTSLIFVPTPSKSGAFSDGVFEGFITDAISQPLQKKIKREVTAKWEPQLECVRTPSFPEKPPQCSTEEKISYYIRVPPSIIVQSIVILVTVLALLCFCNICINGSDEDRLQLCGNCAGALINQICCSDDD